MTKCRQRSLPLQHKHLWPGAADNRQPCLGPGPELTQGHAAHLALTCSSVKWNLTCSKPSLAGDREQFFNAPRPRMSVREERARAGVRGSEALSLECGCKFKGMPQNSVIKITNNAIF